MSEPSERGGLLLLLLLLLLGLAARLGGLDEGFWIDEVISADTAAMPTLELLTRSGLADVHPPGYYLMLKVWTALAGTSDLAARALTLLISLATVAGVAVYARARYGSISAQGAALVLALWPFHVHYGVEVRSYALLAGLTLAALASMERLLERSVCPRRLTVTVVAMGALVWTHTLGLLVAAILLVSGTLKARGPALDVLRAVAWMSAALFAPWLPMLLVQLRHQPEAMTAHLAADLPLSQLLAALGPAPFTSLAPAAGLGALVLGVAWVALWRVPPRQRTEVEGEVAEGGSLRPWHVAATVLALLGPLLPLMALPLSTLTFDLLAGELGLAYGLLVAAGVLIAGLARGAPRLPLPEAPLIAILTVAFLLVLFLVDLARPILNLRNTLAIVPLLAIGLGALVSGRPRAGWLLAAGWLALSASSLSALADRSADGVLPARDDLRGAAQLAQDGQSTVVVLPRWDAPAVSRYLEPDRTLLGALNPGELHLEDVERLMVVLTREAAAESEPYLVAIDRALGARLVRREQVRLRGSPGVEVVRYGAPSSGPQEAPQGQEPAGR